MQDTSRPLRVFLLLALLLPPLLAAALAWYQRAQVLHEAERSAARSMIALEQHAANVLDTHWLVLRQIEGLTRGNTWDQIDRDATLRQTLSELTRDFPQVSTVGMADAAGRLWLSSTKGFSNEISIADRDYFIAHKDTGLRGVFVGEAFTGRASGLRQFAISIVRTTPSGAFDGVIFTTVPLEHFTVFWKQFTPSGGHVIPLIRQDGALIVRYPVLSSPERLKPSGPFMTQLRQAPRGLYTAVSQVDGIERINAYSRIEDYPLFISFSVETALVLRQWRQELGTLALMALLTAATLAALWLAVVRQAHHQRITAARWREIAGDLGRETARRELAEEAMRQGRKMEAVGQLAGGIAHDFNNLLAAIVSNLQLMRMRLAHGRTDDLARYVAAAEAVAGKAGAMTQRLLAFSRRQTLAPAPLDVKERIVSMQELIARTVGPQVRLHTAFSPDPCATLCDSNQLDNALLNLAINARDAMPAGGDLTISAGRTALGAAQASALGLAPADYIAIGIRDTGDGMTAKVIEQAFEPFFTTKPIGEGTGLGLSMVYGFVTQSGGQVKLDSAPGAGTTVTLYLPAHDGAVPRIEAAPESPGRPRPEVKTTILLVDDEEAVREPLAEFLIEFGYDVIQAANGAQGLEVLKSRQPVDLLVSDVGLPGHMNGRQLADAGRVLRPQLKVLFITGYADRAASEGGLQGVGMEVMTKPFGLADFILKVGTMTGAASADDALRHLTP